MFAIIETGGKQYQVSKGTKLEVEMLDGKEGDTIEINKILLISDQSDTKIGMPLVDGAYVTAKILEQGKADKIKVFKMKSKKRYQRNRGHRQNLTTIEITDLKASGGKKIEKKTAKTVVEIPENPPVKKPVKKTPAKPKTVKKVKTEQEELF